MSSVEYVAAMHLKRPKRIDPKAMLSGVQLPKIITARAKNP